MQKQTTCHIRRVLEYSEFFKDEKRLHCQHLKADIDHYITTEQIVSHFGFNTTTAKRYLRQLSEFGYLEPRGGNKEIFAFASTKCFKLPLNRGALIISFLYLSSTLLLYCLYIASTTGEDRTYGELGDSHGGNKTFPPWECIEKRLLSHWKEALFMLKGGSFHGVSMLLLTCKCGDCI